jgi:hypothetical protein
MLVELVGGSGSGFGVLNVLREKYWVNTAWRRLTRHSPKRLVFHLSWLGLLFTGVCTHVVGERLKFLVHITSHCVHEAGTISLKVSYTKRHIAKFL